MLSFSHVPNFMPHLSAGAHRSPRRGACFMEFASYLAGERWSDHPDCTDPVLAALARAVNDSLSDARRDDIATYIPRVIGLRGDDSVVGLIVALRAGVEALPVASMDRQRALALGIQGVRRVMATNGVTSPELERLAVQVLKDVPDAVRWADGYIATTRPGAGPLHPSATQAIARISAVGVAEACVEDADDRLIRMLELAISDVEAVVAAAAPVPREERTPITA